MKTYAGSLGPSDDLRLGDVFVSTASSLSAARWKRPSRKITRRVPSITTWVFHQSPAIATDKGDPELKAKLGEIIGARTRTAR